MRLAAVLSVLALGACHPKATTTTTTEVATPARTTNTVVMDRPLPCDQSDPRSIKAKC